MSAFAPALDFIAITDPGSSLADLARAQEFRGIVDSPADVGGRYSALSVFGLVPAALHGVDLAALLEQAQAMAEACHRPASANPGLRLGATLGEAALAGRDKLDHPHHATAGQLRRLDGAAGGREHRQAGPRHRADRRRAAAGRRAVRRGPVLRHHHAGQPSGPELAELAELADLASALEGLATR